LVFWDSSPLAQAPVSQAQASLTPIGAGTAKATVQMTLAGRRMVAVSFPTGVSGSTAWLVVPTTVGTEVVQCGVDTTSGAAGCRDDLVGDPMIGAPVTLSVDGVAVARGV